MIILGIDPGYGTIGYGVVRFDNMKFTAIQYGAAKTAPGTAHASASVRDL